MSNDPFEIPSSGPKVLAPDGKFPAILYLLADLGHHRDTYEGVETIKHKIYVSFELVGTKMDDGRPFDIGREFTVSPSKFHKGDYYFAKTSNIYKLIKSWSNKDKVRTDPGVLVELLQMSYPATLTVEHIESRRVKDKVNAVIESVKPWKGKDKLVRVNEPVDCLSNMNDFDKLPDWIQKKIKSNLERNGGVPEQVYEDAPTPSDEDDGGIPF